MQSGNTEQWLNIIKNPNESVTNKYKAIFELRQFENVDGAKKLIEAFGYLKDSELLQHEVSYALGQMKLKNCQEVKEFLTKTLEDESQYPVVRHESGEGLSNYCDHFELLELFKKYLNDPVEEVRDTAILACKKTETYKQLKEKYGTSYNGTSEPAAPFSIQEILELLQSKQIEVQEELQAVQNDKFYSQKSKQEQEKLAEKIVQAMNDNKFDLWESYRALYFMRDFAEKIQSQQIVKLIALQLENKNANNLFLHEVCFVLGQVGHLGQLTEQIVRKVIQDQNANHIVRHEAISAFQAVSSDREYMKQFLEDPAPIVKESAIVAYDMIEYWN
ncbi:Armadillo-type fold [Pseudocohnilembus persalinus]|uniref:Armadillo-type fold n=1 Tax=Pseudocohnilembus persalinus TaxID=266149 RepID=A0A0V0QQ27_PSEPJ|nr:Armadillo-type fold [Pseudocohnilembus persalinus]|eukprot:KRX04467.1 Armadillo-type fold [Pseudocohnilembus persalinus]